MRQHQWPDLQKSKLRPPPIPAGARAGKLTANSISTGCPNASSPTRASCYRIGASGNTPCFSTGAKLTTRVPARLIPSYTASLSRLYVEATASACHPPRHPSAQNAASRNPASVHRIMRLRNLSSGCRAFNLQRPKIRLRIRKISFTEENCTRFCGYRGQNDKHFPPSTTSVPFQAQPPQFRLPAPSGGTG